MISDSLGINTSENIGHATRYWFNSESNYINVNPEDCSYIESCNNLLCKIGAPTNFNGQNTLYIESWDNANNKTVEGDPDTITTVNDIWSFSKNMWSSDPTWYLVDTSSK